MSCRHMDTFLHIYGRKKNFVEVFGGKGKKKVFQKSFPLRWKFHSNKVHFVKYFRIFCSLVRIIAEHIISISWWLVTIPYTIYKYIVYISSLLLGEVYQCVRYEEKTYILKKIHLQWQLRWIQRIMDFYDSFTFTTT